VSVLVKICGLTREEDVDAAVAAGADLVGFVLAAESPRAVSAERAAELAARIPEGVQSVAVVSEGDGPAPAVTDLVQTYAPQTLTARTILATRGPVPEGRPAGQPLLLDLAFGSRPDAAELLEHWRAARAVAAPVMLAGSLDAQNVADAVRTARPWAVDTARGVETAPGIKDHELIRRFVANAKGAE
jgi:phosphoribosylanthranilate isomerase